MPDIEAANATAKSHIDGDYVNEPFALWGALVGVLVRMGVCGRSGEFIGSSISEVDDKTLHQAIVIMRQKKTVQTLEERFLDPASPQKCTNPELRNSIVEWIQNNPQLVASVNQLVHTANTTDDIPEFKRALNGLYAFVGRPPAFSFPSPDGPEQDVTGKAAPVIPQL